LIIRYQRTDRIETISLASKEKWSLRLGQALQDLWIQIPSSPFYSEPAKVDRGFRLHVRKLPLSLHRIPICIDCFRVATECSKAPSSLQLRLGELRPLWIPRDHFVQKRESLHVERDFLERQCLDS